MTKIEEHLQNQFRKSLVGALENLAALKGYRIMHGIPQGDLNDRISQIQQILQSA